MIYPYMRTAPAALACLLVSLMSGCLLTLPPDVMQEYPELDSSAETIPVAAWQTPHIAIAGTLIVTDNRRDGGHAPQIFRKSPDFMLNSTRAGLLSQAGFLSVTLHGEIPASSIDGLHSTLSGSNQAATAYELPDGWLNAPFTEHLREAGVTHLLLVAGRVERAPGEDSVTWGVAGGFGVAAPAFTTETEDIYRFNVQGRIYALDSGLMVSDISVSDGQVGSHGVMVIFMPYSIGVDEDAYIRNMALRIGEELGRRFVRGQANH